MELHRNYHWDKKHILVVEDHEQSAQLLGEVLKNTGARIGYSSDGMQAVRYVREHPETDLVLMDIHLPVKDGLTAAREIKSFADHVVVVAQTAYYSADQIQTGDGGIDAFLTKPLIPAVVLDKLSGFLS